MRKQIHRSSYTRPRLVLRPRIRPRTNLKRNLIIGGSLLLLNVAFVFSYFYFGKTENAHATGVSRYAVASGNWNSTSVWSATSGGAPGASVPGISDDVIFMSGPLTVTVTANASCNSLRLENAAGVGDNVLSVNNGVTLTVTGNVDIDGSHHSGSNQDAKLMVDGGVLTVGGNLTVGCHNNQEATLDLSNGVNAASVVNVAGNFTNSITDKGKFFPGTNSTINFNGTAPQLINISNVIKSYANITINNPAGVSLNAHLTSTQLTGNLRVQSGILYTEGYSITQSGGTLEVDNGAQLVLMGASSFPSGFATVILQPNSTVDYAGTAKTVMAHNYGNLTISTGSGSRTVTFDNSGTIGIAGTYSPSSTNNIYSVTGSTISCSGTAAQSIEGTFYNLVINNSVPGNAVTLSNPVTINNDLTLTDGHVITTATNILTLASGATVTLNAPVTQDSSFVKGPMTHTIASTSGTTKTFPVGKNNQMHRTDLTVTQSSATSTQYTGEYINSSANALGYTLPSTLNKVSDISYWNISKGTGASLTSASVKLYYFSSDIVSDASNLRIAKDNGSGLWVNLGGTGSGIPGGSITSTTNFTSFSKFSLANNTGGGNPLPIELSLFKAEVNNLEVDLYWTTSSEINNNYFTIEKSKDGENFQTVTVVDGAGNSNGLKSYHAIDPKPFTGVSYYRLKQVDFDGKSETFKAVSVNLKLQRELVVYPNPVTRGEAVTVLVPAENEKSIQVFVTDVQGKQIFTKSFEKENASDNIIRCVTEKFPAPGTYFITASGLTNTYLKKIVVF